VKDLRDTLVIARREMLERLRSKWFIAITLLGPIGMVALVLVPALLAGRGEGARVEIVDRTGVIAEPLSARLSEVGWKVTRIDPGTSEQVELDRIRDKKINGFITIPEDGLQGGTIVYRGDNGSSMAVQSILRLNVGDVVQRERGRKAGLSPETLDAVLERPKVLTQHTTGATTAASGAATFFLGYILAYILFLVIMLYAIGIMRSVVQEKASRVMELMVATVRPRSLMSGKILGVGTAGLVQFGVWLAMGAITLAYRDEILGAFGTTGTGPALPALAFGEIAVSLLFFIFGYFFYAAMYAAVGAMVSSEQDTQQVQMPITILLVIGMVCVTIVGDNPRGTGATVLTLLPFWSALLMPMRYLLGAASTAEVAISLAIIIVSTVLVTHAAAKIYRVGVLMYGKRPGLKELGRWLRY
jgi:ABC-2 type transport system permease protein